MSSSTAAIVFMLYSAMNGITLSYIFLIFTLESIAVTFFVTAGVFGVMSLYGYLTKTNSTRWGNLLLMLLLGIVAGSLINFFIKSETIYWITTYIGIIVFTVLIAFDTQKIKGMNVIGNEGTDEDKKEAIIGALILYLDFINLFIRLLRLSGKKRKA